MEGKSVHSETMSVGMSSGEDLINSSTENKNNSFSLEDVVPTWRLIMDYRQEFVLFVFVVVVVFLFFVCLFVCLFFLSQKRITPFATYICPERD